jgi:Zn ribbon nucleic-acid-binding protein
MPFGTPESWSSSFHLPETKLPFMLKVTVSAWCPKCAGNMELASTTSNATVFHCSACGHHEVHKGTTSDAIAKAACRHVAQRP